MLGHKKAIGGKKPHNENVLAWSNGLSSGTWRVAKTGDAPFNQFSGEPNNIALHFADKLQRANGGKVYLVGRPVNGSTLLSWSSRDAQNMSAFFAEVETALSREPFVKKSKTVAHFFLWSQGESDDPGATMITEPKSSNLTAYASEFGRMIACLRTQSWFSKLNTTFVASELVDNGWLAARNDFYRSPKLWPADLRMIVTPSIGLGHVGDRAHFDGEALEEIGKRMFEAAVAASSTE